jgi:hypothetical protein
LINQSFSIMVDGRKKNGGVRRGSGRKRKFDEAELMRVMDAACDFEDRVKLFRVQVSRAQTGDTQAAALVLSYMYGKPIQRQEVTGADGEPLVPTTVMFVPYESADTDNS